MQAEDAIVVAKTVAIAATNAHNLFFFTPKTSFRKDL
jgi:hypothetical protein